MTSIPWPEMDNNPCMRQEFDGSVFSAGMKFVCPLYGFAVSVRYDVYRVSRKNRAELPSSRVLEPLNEFSCNVRPCHAVGAPRRDIAKWDFAPRIPRRDDDKASIPITGKWKER